VSRKIKSKTVLLHYFYVSTHTHLPVSTNKYKIGSVTYYFARHIKAAAVYRHAEDGF